MTVQIASSSLLKLGIETEKDVKARESTYLLLDLVRNCSSHLLLGVVKPFSLKQDKNKNTNQSNKQTHALESSTSLIGPIRQRPWRSPYTGVKTALPAELCTRLYDESCGLKNRRNESAGYYFTAVVVNLLCCLKNTSVPFSGLFAISNCLFVCFFVRCRGESTRSTRWSTKRLFSGRSRLPPPPASRWNTSENTWKLSTEFLGAQSCVLSWRRSLMYLRYFNFFS